MPKRLIMVMGVQRSGTTTLFKSLAGDPQVTAFNESVDSRVFTDFCLRPEREIRPVLHDTPGPVLLKPLQETKFRSIAELAAEYSAYDLWIVWLYRDPVNVFYSGVVKGWRRMDIPDVERFTYTWNMRNRRLLSSLPALAAQTAVLRYRDLIADARVLRKLGRFLGLDGNDLFRRDSRAGRKHVPADLQDKIDRETAQVLAALDRRRRFKPRFYKAPFRPFKRRPSAASEPPSRAAITAPGPELCPSQLDSLYLWLRADSLTGCRDGETVHTWPDSGPHAMPAVESTPAAEGAPSARSIDGPRYCSNAINGQPALYFSHHGLGHAGHARHTGQRLEIGSPDDWAFIADGSEFTVLTVFCPADLAPRPWSTAIGMTVIGSGQGFGLGWVRGEQADAALINAAPAQGAAPLPSWVVLALSPPHTHPPETWRIVVCTHKQRADGQNMAIYTGWGQAGRGTRSRVSDYPNPTQATSGLVLGQDRWGSGHRLVPFAGYLAEVIVWKKALSDRDRLGVTAYLGKKYGIQDKGT